MLKKLMPFLQQKKKVLIFIFFLFFSLFSFAQQKIIVNGNVFTENNVPLASVSVNVKGSSGGTTTDADGKFTIQVSKGATLVLSFVGYEEKQVFVNNEKSVINIQMVSITSTLENVVVAYGVQKKTAVTGSIASISGKEIKTISTANLVTGLAGKLPGLRVTQRTGEPGSYTTAFDIRGFGSPLLVIDGVVGSQSDFARLDPNDIESISVLKDATAAVYGIKAANGVILINTKKGQTTGKPQITYSGSYEIQKVTNTPQVGNAYQYAVLTTENEINGGAAPGGTTYSKEDIQKFKDGTYPSTDWMKLVARNYTALKHHNLSVTGGSEKIRYFASLGGLDEMGLWKSGDLNYQKYNFRSSVTGKITENLEAQININGMLENKNEPGDVAWNVFKFTWMNIPTYSVYANNNPQYLQDMTYPWNPLAMTNASIGGYTKTKTKTFNGNFVLDYTVPFIHGLKAKFTYGFYSQDYFQKAWRKAYSTYSYDKLSDTYTLKGTQNSPSNLTENYTPYQRSSVAGQLTYEKSFQEKHNIKAALVFEERHEKNDNMWAQKLFAIDV